MTQSQAMAMNPSAPSDDADDDKMLSRLFSWIWHVNGELDLPSGQSNADTFDRLSPLFETRGTTHERTFDTLIFQKKDPAAQDKMSVFDRGTLRIEDGARGPVLRYRLVSRYLLLCFLAPLVFLAFSQVTVAVGKLEASMAHDAAKKDEKKKDVQLPQHWIDKALGSPAPEKPKKDKKEEGKKPSPTASYVFAALFALLYGVGRILEARLAKRLFRKALANA